MNNLAHIKSDSSSLEKRIGHVHLRQRLSMEQGYEAQMEAERSAWAWLRNIEFADRLIRRTLKSVGLHGRGRRNARAVEITPNPIQLRHLPPAFDGYRILHISDLHLDIADDIPAALIAAVKEVEFDVCVLTGDFRAATYGDTQPCIAGLAEVRDVLGERVYAVLGNHDSIAMVPHIEGLNISTLLNESTVVQIGGDAIYLAGIDDPHYFRLHDIAAAASAIPTDAVSILLSHSPEAYKNAAHAGFDVLLAGHTHGGQICLPGGWPVMLNARCRREYCRGRWRYRQMQGYTSNGSGACVVDVRFNCPPEIVLHTLSCAR